MGCSRRMKDGLKIQYINKYICTMQLYVCVYVLLYNVTNPCFVHTPHIPSLLNSREDLAIKGRKWWIYQLHGILESKSSCKYFKSKLSKLPAFNWFVMISITVEIIKHLQRSCLLYFLNTLLHIQKSLS